MKRILVPTDFSPTAEKAFHLAADIAAKTGGNIILYHAYAPVQNILRDAKQIEQENKEKETILLKRLLRLKKKLTATVAAVPVSTVLGHTPVTKNILDFAKHNEIDLVVMGTQGASGIIKTLVGSVASHVIEHATIPVLLVPEKYAWKEPKHIVYASNYLAGDRKALSILLPLAKLYDAITTVIHLYDVYLLDEQKEINDFETFAFTMQREFNDHKLTFRLMKTSSVIASMENLQIEIPYDMVAMVRSRKTLTEHVFNASFTENMAYVTNRLLFVMPEET